MEPTVVCENAFYLLALLNPASKIMFLASCEPKLTKKTTLELSWKSSLAALLILILLAGAGQFILEKIFKVELYSLRITGGLVVFMIGWTAIAKGKFIQRGSRGKHEDVTDISLVPLAAPLIAGPGMIAAAIASSVEYGLPVAAAALSIAILINFLLMIFAGAINGLLSRTHLLGPLIRLTGLVIAVTAMQMIITGVKTCFNC